MRIVVPSSNQTSWLMRGCVHLLNTHWPQHPPIVMGGYDKPTGLPDSVEFIKIGEWADYPVNKWSDGLIKLLESITDELICLHLDDFWLIQDVDPAVVDCCLTVLVFNADYPRIDLTDDRLFSGSAVDESHIDFTGHDGKIHPVDIISTPPNTPYTGSFQTGIWRKSELLRFLVPGETPAEAEIRGSNRMSRAGASALGTKQAPVKYLIVQQHGKLHFDDSGYQSPDTRLLPEDRAELERLGYLSRP